MPAAKGQMSIEELLEKVQELRRYKIEEERDKMREHAQRQKNMRTARGKLQREIQATALKASRSDREASNLNAVVAKLGEQQEISAARKQKLDEAFEQHVTSIESRQCEKAELLQGKMQETGRARGRLSHLQFAMRSLEQNMLIQFDDVSNRLRQKQGDNSTAESAMATTAMMQSEVNELQVQNTTLSSQNATLREELQEVRRQFYLQQEELLEARRRQEHDHSFANRVSPHQQQAHASLGESHASWIAEQDSTHDNLMSTYKFAPKVMPAVQVVHDGWMQVVHDGRNYILPSAMGHHEVHRQVSCVMRGVSGASTSAASTAVLLAESGPAYSPAVLTAPRLPTSEVPR
eukprot:gnl/TRDRNA2_/TRDRNA2_193025_c0_seq1.p1 gnl/TRDRNA2_/TRDRNA2_193025_c0~~gnl/TRDRNA2_/TRDRNA2_193025_c0_seq1.p1  ORF type:complete len:377 (-),score=76.58 gnl/TRDRNA2_/TRDRNA2_193025_c0_seq1:75-1121(-)